MRRRSDGPGHSDPTSALAFSRRNLSEGRERTPGDQREVGAALQATRFRSRRALTARSKAGMISAVQSRFPARATRRDERFAIRDDLVSPLMPGTILPGGAPDATRALETSAATHVRGDGAVERTTRADERRRRTRHRSGRAARASHHRRRLRGSAPLRLVCPDRDDERVLHALELGAQRLGSLSRDRQPRAHR